MSAMDQDQDANQVGSSSQSDFTEFTSDANFSVFFKLVRNYQDIEDDFKKGAFYPDFVHQFFGETERIFGYKRPVLKMFYSASRLKRYINFEYEDKLNLEKHGIEPDDVMKSIEPMLDGLSDFTQNINQFSRELDAKEELEFRPPGTLLHTFDINFRPPSMLSRAQLDQINEPSSEHQNNSKNKAMTNGSSKASNGDLNGTNVNGSASLSKRTFCIYKATLEDPGFSQFQARMQSFVMWFIDAANVVDVDDDRWDYFLVFEKTIPEGAPNVTNEERYFFVGYSTVYRYYAYPDKVRPRVSQMLLLPPFRKNTIGTNLLQTIYNWYTSQRDTLDITAEDPNEEFIYMRDVLDCKNCMKLDAYQPHRLTRGWSDDMAKEAQDKLRICKRQARKVYEILKLRNLDSEDEFACKKFRLEIKNRLNAPAQRAKLDCEKAEKRGAALPEELRANQVADITRFEVLKENYDELERQYRNTIRKLASMID